MTQKETNPKMTITKKLRSKNLKFVQGRVISDKMDKTRVILLEMRRLHPLFKKSILRSRKIKIHDERNEAQIGDLVRALEVTRPLSRTKRHRLFKIMERAK